MTPIRAEIRRLAYVATMLVGFIHRRGPTRTAEIV
jgi:hypothetical protein